MVERRQQYSLDGGATWHELPADGLRVLVIGCNAPGEDEPGELHWNFTHEGLITDVWCSRAETGENYNVATQSMMYDELVAHLVKEEDRW